MKQTKRFFMTTVIILTTIVAPAGAYTMDDVRIEGTYGSGSNAALLVVDFWPGNGQSDSFAFECQFDGTTTGTGLLDTVANGNVNFSYAFAPNGALGDVWYTDPDTGTSYHTTYDWDASWWSYWVSADYGETWGWTNYGPNDEVVANGGTNGWLGKPGSDWTSEPMTPVPEPVGASLLILGGVMAAFIKRKR